MIFHRLWLPILVASLLFAGMAGAQDTGGNAAPANGGGSATGGAGDSAPGGTPAAGNGTPSTNNGTPAGGNGTPGSATPGASSTFGTQGATPATPAQGNLPSQGQQGQGVPVLPGQPTPGGTTPAPGPGSTLPGQPPTGPGATTPGAASSFGNTQGQAGAQLHEAPPSFSVPGFYGRGPVEFTAGVGRLARPLFRFSATMSQGYDDNVFQTPTHGFHTPSETIPREVSAGSPATTRQALVPSGDPAIPDAVENVAVPATLPAFKNVNIPGVPAAQRLGSWVTRTNGVWDMQFANRHSLFTFDLTGGADYYWDRPGGRTDYNGTLSLIYLQKLTSRAQFTIDIAESYQTQPDFSQPNLPTSNQVGPYLNSNIKADLSYRLTPRFSSVTSITYTGVSYEETSQSGQNNGSTTFGTELRYLFSPRVTLVGEARYTTDLHENQNALNTKNYFLLIGEDITLSKRFSTTLRVGEEVEEFTEGGGSQGAPYAEATLNYRLSPATTVEWNGRYGYEEAGAVGARNIVARSGLQLTQVFSPRLQASLSLNLVRSSLTTNTVASTSSSSTSSTSSTASSTNSAETAAARASAAELAVPIDQVQDTIDASVGFYYTLSRHWSFNLTYSYTTALGPIDIDSYYRQRVFIGGTYQF